MTDAPVSFVSSGPPETILDDEPAEARAALAEAAVQAVQGVQDSQGAQAGLVAAFGSVCVRWPTCLEAWASLGEALQSQDQMALAYAAFRTGYHRGLDRLRASGWRGSGFVRWQYRSNRGFLRALNGLRSVAEHIGETNEAQRCALFLTQLDPDWPPSDFKS